MKQISDSLCRRCRSAPKMPGRTYCGSCKLKVRIAGAKKGRRWSKKKVQIGT